eukprot:2640283-Heterocapsa_arctica.AAC.1
MPREQENMLDELKVLEDDEIEDSHYLNAYGDRIPYRQAYLPTIARRCPRVKRPKVTRSSRRMRDVEAHGGGAQKKSKIDEDTLWRSPRG